jgi:magnesium transporter
MVSDVSPGFVGRPETALSHACTQVPKAAANDLVSATLDDLRGKRFDSVAAVAVVDGERLVGVATIERLFAASDGTTLGDVMDPETPVVAPDTD